MNKCSKLLIIFSLIICLIIVAGCSSPTLPKLHVTVESQVISSNVEIFFYDENNVDTAMCPYQELLEALDVPSHNIKYHEKSHSLEIRKGETYIFLTEENKNPIVNTQLQEIPAPPVMKDGQLCIPIKFIAETLGYKVIWNEAEKRIEITS